MRIEGILSPRQFNMCVKEGAIESRFLINVDISEEKDLLVQQLAEKDKTIAKLRECVEFYAEKMNRHNGVAKQCLKEIENQSSTKTEGE